MDGNKKFFDLSSYLLFEDTGDSETVDDDHALINLKQVIKNSTTKDEEHDNDAMSRSSVFSEDCLVAHNRKRKTSPVNKAPADNRNQYRYLQRASEDGNDWEAENDDEGVVNQALKKTKHDNEHQESRNNNCGDKSMKLICQREQDKLFWEACLGS